MPAYYINSLGTRGTSTNGTIGPQGIQGIQGETGPPGPKGDNGIDGTNGTNGIDGTNGAQGPPGPKGDNGIDGTNGTNGTDGAQGPPGPKGDNGIDGADGADGTIININASYNDAPVANDLYDVGYINGVTASVSSDYAKKLNPEFTVNNLDSQPTAFNLQEAIEYFAPNNKNNPIFTFDNGAETGLKDIIDARLPDVSGFALKTNPEFTVNNLSSQPEAFSLKGAIEHFAPNNKNNPTFTFDGGSETGLRDIIDGRLSPYALRENPTFVIDGVSGEPSMSAIVEHYGDSRYPTKTNPTFDIADLTTAGLSQTAQTLVNIIKFESDKKLLYSTAYRLNLYYFINHTNLNPNTTRVYIYDDNFKELTEIVEEHISPPNSNTWQVIEANDAYDFFYTGSDKIRIVFEITKNASTSAFGIDNIKVTQKAPDRVGTTHNTLQTISYVSNTAAWKIQDFSTDAFDPSKLKNFLDKDPAASEPILPDWRATINGTPPSPDDSVMILLRNSGFGPDYDYETLYYQGDSSIGNKAYIATEIITLMPSLTNEKVFYPKRDSLLTRIATIKTDLDTANVALQTLDTANVSLIARLEALETEVFPNPYPLLAFIDISVRIPIDYNGVNIVQNNVQYPVNHIGDTINAGLFNNGPENDYQAGLNIDMSTLGVLDNGQDLTFEITFKYDPGALFSIGDFSSGGKAIGIILFNTKLTFYVWGTKDYEFNISPNTADFTDLVAIYDSSTGAKEIYINGLPISVATIGGGGSGIVDLTSNKLLRIGNIPIPGVGQWSSIIRSTLLFTTKLVRGKGT